MWHDSDITFRNNYAIKKLRFDDEGIATKTSREQQKTETVVLKCFDRFEQFKDLHPDVAKLNRIEHQNFLEGMLRHLPQNYECLDSSRPWCIYWILQALEMLNYKFDERLIDDVIEQLVKCRCVNGGFAGGPGQNAHLAPTYAAVCSLCIIGTPKAFEAIDCASLIDFLFYVRDSDGSFRLHVGGEIDVRGAYCAVACAKLVNTAESVIARLFAGTADWIAKCQTYEGGFGGAPNLEAHGGYTFCAIAALALLNEHEKCDKKALLKWSIQRQMSLEGGFQGRTNKLVDGCYSFWVGAIIPITEAILANDGLDMQKALFDVAALQEYILLCCQKKSGGLIDKPGKPQDLYHTCYTLSGMSIAQHAESSLCPQVLGVLNNEVAQTHPLFNIPPKAVVASLAYFSKTENNSFSTKDVSPSSDDAPIIKETAEETDGPQ